jgi:hypothetical protein
MKLKYKNKIKNKIKIQKHNRDTGRELNRIATTHKHNVLVNVEFGTRIERREC